MSEQSHSRPICERSLPTATRPQSRGPRTHGGPLSLPRWPEPSARSVLPGCSDCAQDIAQAALTKVMAAERRSEGERHFSTFYLYRVAHSALVDEIRQRKRRAEVSLECVSNADDATPALEPTDQDDPESAASLP